MLINDRLSTFLTQHAGEMAFVQRSHCTVSIFYLFHVKQYLFSISVPACCTRPALPEIYPFAFGWMLFGLIL